MMYVKILANGKSQNGGTLNWSLPVQNDDGTWTPGDWHEVNGKIVPCQNGLHAATLKHRYHQWHRFNSEHYELEFDGKVIEDGDKFVGRKARLVRHIPHEQFWLDVKAFVASLSDIAWFSHAGEIQAHWDVYPTWDAAWEARRAARDEARVAAWDAAWEAAREAAREARRAVQDAARKAAWEEARDAARKAAWEAAWKAAWKAAREAAWEAAREAAVDAELLAACIVSGLSPEDPHYRHAQARMDVWRAGYGLCCDYTDADGNIRFIVYKQV